jgi:hypothetical protein
VTITITAVSDAPVAAAGTLSTTAPASGTLSASDVDGDALNTRSWPAAARAAAITNASTGAYTPPNANVRQRPNHVQGQRRRSTRARDGDDHDAAVNDAPVAANGSLTTAEDTAAGARWSPPMRMATR